MDYTTEQHDEHPHAINSETAHDDFSSDDSDESHYGNTVELDSTTLQTWILNQSMHL